MKVIKTVTIDFQIAEKLKQSPNASGLINDLLEQHFRLSKPMSLEEIDKRIAIVKLKRETESKIKEIEGSITNG